MLKKTYSYLLTLVALMAGLLILPATGHAQSPNPQSGSVGMQGQISAPPPSTPATISTPATGQDFSALPVTVSGLCSDDLLVRVFKNNVFAGAAQCQNGSYSVTIDLFNGQNELVARVYDALDQAGPDSNVVVVTFTDDRSGSTPRISLTSNFAKRGANPGQLLSWPITVSGGQGPYAVSVDWGDGSALDLISRSAPGTFNIEHTYDSPGVYNLIVKATDQNDNAAFLQLVAIGNGPLGTEEIAGGGEADEPTVRIRILWLPVLVSLPLLLVAFWLGRRHMLKVLRRRIERGERPF